MSVPGLLYQRYDFRIELRAHDPGERSRNACAHCCVACVAKYIENASLDEVVTLKRMHHARTEVFVKIFIDSLGQQNVDWQVLECSIAATT